ncbi:MAG: toxic anion resistance protein [Fusobacteriaceae bacterium]|jgi:uncharacterized protein YaaN involved in tellurite resistance|nr:toxic anion resistance protein [Fusobacteriaceae bacterium]
MAIDFKKNESVVLREEKSSDFDGLQAIQYDVIEDRNMLSKELANSKEVEELVGQISPYDTTTIVSFGGETAEGISKCSDVVLNSMNMSQINDTGEMLSVLKNIMDKFDIDEIRAEPGFFKKIFGDMKKQIEKILSKYQTMGTEVDKIFIKLKEYENEIHQSNKKLESMFQENVKYYHDLLKYILAGEHGIIELNEYTEKQRIEMEQTGKREMQFDIVALEQAKQLLEQRVQDLRIAENVAMQSIPMLKTMQFSNVNLVRKINSAFIITLPVFKQAISQAILLKRQKIQAEAMDALDKKTNELLLKNAQNTVEQSKMTAKMVTGSSVKIETLEQTWKTIVSGIAETKQISDNMARQREEDKKRLDIIKNDFNKMFGK